MVTTRSAQKKQAEPPQSAPTLPAHSRMPLSTVSTVSLTAAKRSTTKDTRKKLAPLAGSSSTAPGFFLFKSEPESRIQNDVDMKFSIDDLIEEKNQTTHWDGVRNAEARNILKEMKKGDLGFFYHSNTRKSRPGIVGIVRVVKEAYPDFTAFDKEDPHFDPKSSRNAPKWFMVDVRFVKKFPRCITLDEVKAHPRLSYMQLVKRARISVQRVTREEWQTICVLANAAY